MILKKLHLEQLGNKWQHFSPKVKNVYGNSL